MSKARGRPLAALIRRFRLSAGLGQDELAGQSGLSARTISDLERGLRLTPGLETIRMPAEGLNLSDAERASLIAASRPELLVSLDYRLVELPNAPGEIFGRDSDVADLAFLITINLAATCGLPDHAARLLGSYCTHYSSLGIRHAYVDPALDFEIGSLRDQVGAVHFDAEYHAGIALTMSEAMEIALQVLDCAETRPMNRTFSPPTR